MYAGTSDFPIVTDPWGDRRPRRALPWPSGTARATALVAALLAALGASLASERGGARSGPATAAASAPPAALAPTAVMSVGDRLSHNGRYRVEVDAPPAPRLGVSQAWVVRVARPGRQPLADARVAVTLRMPETGALSPMAAHARAVGDGRYAVDGIYFARPGWWNVALVIAARDGVDSVAFNVVVPPSTSR